MNFKYIGKTDIRRYLKYTDTSKGVWEKRCSARDEWNKPHRTVYEQNLYRHYNENNSVYYTLDIPRNEVEPTLLKEADLNSYSFKSNIISSYPGNMEGMHIDLYGSFLGRNKSLADIEDKIYTIKRVWIPLQDSVMGQLFFTPDNTLQSWKAGDMFEVPNKVFHGFANVSDKQRFTLLLTGYRRTFE